ncbi:ABC transporter ATP-binding protein [Streptococcus loxodontisalivarius]|uniref:ATP-binding cassette subfamily B protein n=1 Tax=Streptococcus loxodontisalivarius TaxID=1349415 RepID=A0ABS2PS79_9STRE|nr:ABC transporter ATP-binding protein [Streptococcus loxodontisalivarius]MBM7642898.1 ATP-binding cassette subfamily B protein [Streptococcus loxodontisalivarius]
MIKLFKRLNGFEWLMILISVCLVAFGVWLDLELPSYISDMVTLLSTKGTTVADIMKPGMKMIYLALASLATSVTVGFIAARLAAGFTTRIRGQIFDSVMDYSQTEIKKFSIPSLITRTTNDLTQIQNMITMGLQVITKGPIMAVWALTKIAGKSGDWMTATVVAVGVVAVLLTTLLVLAFPKQTKIQQLTDKLNGLTRENLTGLRVVRAYNAEGYEEEKFEKANTDVTGLNLFVNRIMGLLNPVMTLVSSGLTLSIYWIGAYLIDAVKIPTNVAQIPSALSDRVTLYSDMITFSSYAMQVVFGFMMMTIVFIVMPRSIVSARRINEVLDLDSSVLFKEKTSKSTDLVGQVEFQDVSFRYNKNSADVIEHVSFTAKKGDTVAFIGSTGSGKSTLISLIPRFYDATGGHVLVDGVDVRDYSRDDLNNKVGYIPQKAVLFSGDVKSNLDFGVSPQSPLSDEAMWDALQLAQSRSFIEIKDEKLDARVAQGGSNFSGGQKQRLAIARALARKPEIIIFDDSFSALDYKTDRKLRADLAEQTKDMTKLIVAQRISTIMDADQILVLDEGKVVGQGTHKELLANNSVYQEIAYSQLSKEELANG